MSNESLPVSAEASFPVLSERARSDRRNLLALSAVCIGMVWTGSVPTKVSALGIEFSQSDRTALLRMLAAVVFYFLVAFVCYAIPDF
jgi:hypothetical protein